MQDARIYIFFFSLCSVACHDAHAIYIYNYISVNLPGLDNLSNNK